MLVDCASPVVARDCVHFRKAVFRCKTFPEESKHNSLDICFPTQYTLTHLNVESLTETSQNVIVLSPPSCAGSCTKSRQNGRGRGGGQLPGGVPLSLSIASILSPLFGGVENLSWDLRFEKDLKHHQSSRSGPPPLPARPSPTPLFARS